ncbi:hypothetical protein JKP88DRAFT_348383 [Tribonema minus]|uniref:Carbohydrate sulfotransferase n=1 Tax=Tribonema minus TaxID=303371 RepID=A0A835Z3G3_9STRA|nr:hypothetical protein JKP88DRAFT_348383 [Tribonema minus]
MPWQRQGAWTGHFKRQTVTFVHNSSGGGGGGGGSSSVRREVNCLAFNKLFNSLRSRYDPSLLEGPAWNRTSHVQHRIKLKTLTRMIYDPTWHKAVFYREPLARFLSAYRSKCESGHDDGAELCEQEFGKPNPTFEEAVERLVTQPYIWNPHWRPQVDFCSGLSAITSQFLALNAITDAQSSNCAHYRERSRMPPQVDFCGGLSAIISQFPTLNAITDAHSSNCMPPHPHCHTAVNAHAPPQVDFCGGLSAIISQFQTVEALDARTSRDKVTQLLHRVGIEDAETIPAFNERFPPLDPETGEWRPHALHSNHTTNAESAVEAYYTPYLACRVFQYFIDDYILFGIPVPAWTRKWDFHAQHWATADCATLRGAAA